jgi:two-component system LytT family sensor kinase
MTPAVLVNLAGFFLGAVLYGMLLVMALGPGRGAAPTAGWVARLRSPASRLVMLTGLFGLLWNVGALTVYGFTPAAPSNALQALLAVAFSALGFLPAVVVHSVLTRGLEGQPSRGARLTIAVAYLLSATAAVMHIRTALQHAVLPSPIALDVLTAGFGGLMLALLVGTRRQAREGRAIWVVALSVFAVSALHLAQHTGGESWWTEVVGHHASLFLALAILNRDYRFALADIFLKRALALTLLVGVVLALHVTVGIRWLATDTATPTGAPLTTYLLALALFSAAAYDRIRRVSAWFVDTVLLRRPDYEELPSLVAADLAEREQPDAILRFVSERIAKTLDATWVRAAELHTEPSSHAIVYSGADALTIARTERTERTAPAASAGDAATAATVSTAVVANGGMASAIKPGATPHMVVVIPTVDAPHHAFFIGELLGGRRLLSGDISLLESIALVTARRLDTLRVAHERIEASVREQQISRLATEAELRALRAQLNPHFLFNALTTVGYLIQTSPTRAMDTLLRLTSLLRGVLRRTTTEFGTLGDELDLIEAYLEIEQARFEERLRVTIDVPAALRTLPIPPLLVQPLVENAVKHGIAQSAGGGEVVVAAFLESDGDHREDARGVRAHSPGEAHQQQLRLSVRDTGVGSTEAALARGRSRGVGIASIEHRLRCHYGEHASLRISTLPDVGTTVDLVIPVHPARRRPAGEPSVTTPTP